MRNDDDIRDLVGDMKPMDLKAFLISICPPDSLGRRSIPILAGHMGYTNQALYKWLDEGKIPAKAARQIVSLPGTDVTMEDFVPYL